MLLASAVAVPVMHELAHTSVRWLHYLRIGIGVFIGLPFAVNFLTYRRYHLEHHRLLGRDNDPEGEHCVTSVGGYLHALFLLPVLTTLSALANGCFGRFPHYVRDDERR